MYLDALSFLEDERDAWRPFEALLDLTDKQLERPVAGAHGWSGRLLMGHLVAWQLVGLDVAKELAVREVSTTKARADADWAERGGEVVNAEIDADWAAPADQRGPLGVRSGLRRAPRILTVVPESRWIKNADHQRFFVDETLDHYDEHLSGPGAILAAAGA